MLNRRARVIVISSVSGGGKTSLIRMLTRRHPALQTAITATSRPPRPGEVDGVHYHFLTPQRFSEMIAAGSLLEHAVVHGNYYGVPADQVNETLEAGRSIILNVDVQGMRHIKERLSQRVLSIFILPPDPITWERRLRDRATDPEEAIRRRLEEGQEEMKASAQFDYCVVNDVLERAAGEVSAILEKEGIL